MEKYQQLKEVIQKTNPEITELKFGCEIGNSKRLSLKYIGKSNGQHALAYTQGGGDEMLIVDNLNAPILVRPIKLADVLLAIDKAKLNNEYESWVPFEVNQIGMFTSDVYDWESQPIFWNLKDDDLDHQSQETKEFLINLLV